MDTNGKGNSYFPGNLACLGKAERRRVANLACLGTAERRRVPNLVERNTFNTSLFCSKLCSKSKDLNDCNRKIRNLPRQRYEY